MKGSSSSWRLSGSRWLMVLSALEPPASATSLEAWLALPLALSTTAVTSAQLELELSKSSPVAWRDVPPALSMTAVISAQLELELSEPSCSSGSAMLQQTGPRPALGSLATTRQVVWWWSCAPANCLCVRGVGRV